MWEGRLLTATNWLTSESTAEASCTPRLYSQHRVQWESCRGEPAWCWPASGWDASAWVPGSPRSEPVPWRCPGPETPPLGLKESAEARDENLRGPQQEAERKEGEEAAAVPLLYLRKMAMVRGQILFSALVVKAGLTVQTMHSVSMTRVSTSELNWAASWTSPSRMLGRKGCRTWVLSDSFSWSQYLEKPPKIE